MRKLFLALGLFMFYGFIYGQQDAQYTQFMFNKLALNPGYAGSAGTPCVSCLHRSQWAGFEGAPVSQTLNFHMPMFKKRVGLGVSIQHDQLGPTDSWVFNMIYAYRMKLGNGDLSFGLQGSMRNYKINWSKTTATQSGDGLIPGGASSKVLPNFGAGVYYETPKYFFGLSIPHMISSDLTFTEGKLTNTNFSREQMHAFLMAGAVFDLSKTIKLKPSILMKYVENAPFDMDVNASLIFFEKFWTGLTYRLGGVGKNSAGESVDMIVQYQFSPAIRAGIAYDFSLSEVRTYNSGTYEIMIDYCLSHSNKRLTNPRFF